MVNLRIVILPYGKIAIANIQYGNFTIPKFTVIGLDIKTPSNRVSGNLADSVDWVVRPIKSSPTESSPGSLSSPGEIKG